MLSAIAIAALALMQPPRAMNFDADKTGELPPQIETSPGPAAWVVTGATTGPSGNQFLSINPAHCGTELLQCFFKDIVLQNLTFSARVLVGPQCSAVQAVAADAEKPDECGIFLRAAGNRSCRIALSAADKTLKILVVADKETRTLASVALPEFTSARWFTIDIALDANTISCALDGKQVLKTADILPLTYGKIGLFSNTRGTFQIDDINIKDTLPILSQELKIRGMSCILCEAKIETALKAVKGVKDAKANHTDGSCVVTLDENAPAEIDALVKAVEAIHYQVSLEGA